MSDLEAIKDDIGGVKKVVDTLKIDVAVIKTEVSDMKSSVTNAVDKIADSMITLAKVSEKLNTNIDEHSKINKKIDNIQDEQDAQRVIIHDIQVSHERCYNKQKQKAEEAKNSPLQKAKDKLIEWTFVFLVALVVFIIYSHIGGFLSWMNASGINVGISASP